MGSLSNPLVLRPDGTLGREEEDLISAWLEMRLNSYQPAAALTGWVAGPAEVSKLLTTGTSTLKRRYKGSDLRASAVVWGWLGRKSIAGGLCSTVTRPRQGGTAQICWQLSAMLEGGWVRASGLSCEMQRMERLLGCVGRCAGISSIDGGWVLGPRSTWQLMQMLRRHYEVGTAGMDLLSLDIAALVEQGIFSGDCLRRKVGGGLDYDWWSRVRDLTDEDLSLVSIQTIEKLSLLIPTWYSAASLPSPGSLKRGLHHPQVLWVLDLFCGFRSLGSPVKAVLDGYCRAGDVVKCIGLDICERLVRGADIVVPDICLDFLDHQALPCKSIIRQIASLLGLDPGCLVHIHASSPCDTNSRADASNRTRGCGYRDLHTPHCDPLGLSDTSPDHRQLAIDHDRLEIKLFKSLVFECELLGLCFGVENPVGAMARKRHVMRLLSSRKITRVTVDHCNFTPENYPAYGKATDYFVNFTWAPKGQSGDGRCGKTGRRTGVQCKHGYMNLDSGRWNHHHTIARASTSEISGPGLHRRSQKNHLPHDECVEMLQASAVIWSNSHRP